MAKEDISKVSNCENGKNSVGKPSSFGSEVVPLAFNLCFMDSKDILVPYIPTNQTLPCLCRSTSRGPASIRVLYSFLGLSSMSSSRNALKAHFSTLMCVLCLSAGLWV